jgi:nucleoside-diphosphate-sugar epimerase
VYSIHIIGGTGFFGKSFIENQSLKILSRFNINKIILSSRNSRTKKIIRNNIEINFLKKDITLAKDIPYTDIIIFAATSSLSRNYSKNIKREISNSNKGITNLLKIISNQKFKKTKVLFTSSGAVYGQNQKKKAISEKKKIDKKNLKNYSKNKYYYALAKIKAEEKLKEFSKRKRRYISIARCFAFIGNNLYLNEHYLIGNIARAIIYKKKLIINQKNRSQIYRSYMCASDLVEWLLAIILRSKQLFSVYNVGSSEALSLNDILYKFEKKYKFRYNKTKEKKTDFDYYIPNIDYYIPNIQKAKKNLNLKIKKNLNKSFNELISFYSK